MDILEDTHLSLEGSHLQTRQDLSCLIAVADIFEKLGGVLPGHI
jgi:hypothetical protein